MQRLLMLMGFIVLAMMYSSHGFSQSEEKNQALPLLTQERVESWIKGFENAEALSVKGIAENVQDDLSVGEAMENMQANQNFQAFQAYLSGIGYKDVETWMQVGSQIVQAFAALNMTKQQAEVDAKMAEAISKIENDQSLSQQQKQFMRQILEGGKKFVENVQNAPEQDKQSVRPYFDKLDNLFKRQQ
jgi:Zn-dependent M32 family carboxypeptidase